MPLIASSSTTEWQSGDKTVFSRTIVLTAGRVYPLQIDFWQRKRKTKQPPANIALSWVPPHGTERVIPAGNLVQFSGGSTFSLQTKLPADDRSFGYVRGTAIDRQWSESTTAAALEFAQFALDDLWPNYRRRNRSGKAQQRETLRRFLRELVETAFRGPLDKQTAKLYVDDQINATKDDAEAIKRSVLIALKSPRFLYPLLDSDRTRSQRVANRLTLTLLDSLPADRWLTDLVDRDQLQKPAAVRRAAQRLVQDYRLRGKTREWLYEWLNLGYLHELSKDDKLFPGFDAALASELRNSFDAFLDQVVWRQVE